MADPRRTSGSARSGTSSRRRIPVELPEEEKKELNENSGENDEYPTADEEAEPAEITLPEDQNDKEILELQERLLRLQAEFNNYRKRQARDFSKLCFQGKRDLIEELLAVLDNYHRAEQLRDEGGHPVKEIAEGLFRTSEQLLEILRQEGLEPMDVKMDDPFDPNFHEAMLAEDREDLDRESILDVFQKGYILNGDLLRPARVKVGRPVHTGEAAGNHRISEEEGAAQKSE